MDINKYRLKGKTTYLIANSENYCSTDNFLDAVAKELENGIEVVELRENCSAYKIIEHGKRIRELCSIYNALFIVHDRLDVAKIVHADGIHLPVDGIDINTTKEFFEENIIIGTSIEAQTEILEKELEKYDYILCSKTTPNIAKIHTFSKIKKLI